MVYTKLEIHLVNIGAGDCTIMTISRRDATVTAWTTETVLVIDGGESTQKRIIAYMEQYGVGRADGKIDYVVASHYHSDHIAGLLANDFLDTGKAQCLIDTGGYQNCTWKPLYFVDLPSVGLYSLYTEMASAFVGDGQRVAGMDGMFFTKSGKDTIALKFPPSIIMSCLAAGGAIWGGGKPIRPLKAFGTKQQGFEPNTHSMAFLLQWDDFSYFTAGDLPASIADPLGTWMRSKDGPKVNVAVMKANHHGSTNPSGDSRYNAPAFIEALNPSAIVVTANASYILPTQTFFEETLSKSSIRYVWVVNKWAIDLSGAEDAKRLFMEKTNCRPNPDVKNDIFLPNADGIMIYVSDEPVEQSPQLKTDADLNVKGKVAFMRTLEGNMKASYEEAALAIARGSSLQLPDMESAMFSAFVAYLDAADTELAALIRDVYRQSGDYFRAQPSRVLATGDFASFIASFKDGFNIFVGGLLVMQVKNIFGIEESVLKGQDGNALEIVKAEQRLETAPNLQNMDLGGYFLSDSTVRRGLKRIVSRKDPSNVVKKIASEGELTEVVGVAMDMYRDTQLTGSKRTMNVMGITISDTFEEFGDVILKKVKSTDKPAGGGTGGDDGAMKPE